MTMLIATHDEPPARSPTMCFLHEGRILEQATRRVVERSTNERRFLRRVTGPAECDGQDVSPALSC
jgi:hypothetical protein